jgi:hypothetical protein
MRQFQQDRVAKVSSAEQKVPSEKQILQFMGFCLILVQAVERMLGLVTTFVLQKPNMTSQKLLEQAQKESKRTLGYFLKELHKRADIHPNFDDTLSRFLESRNKFAHSLSDIPGWDLQTEDGRATAARFLMELAQTGGRVMSVFVALTKRWTKEAKIHVPSQHEIIDEIAKVFGPLVDEIFMAKETKQ